MNLDDAKKEAMKLFDWFTITHYHQIMSAFVVAINELTFVSVVTRMFLLTTLLALVAPTRVVAAVELNSTDHFNLMVVLDGLACSSSSCPRPPLLYQCDYNEYKCNSFGRLASLEVGFSSCFLRLLISVVIA